MSKAVFPPDILYFAIIRLTQVESKKRVRFVYSLIIFHPANIHYQRTLFRTPPLEPTTPVIGPMIGETS